jgi:serine/threonine protein phosphatase PrpC
MYAITEIGYVRKNNEDNLYLNGAMYDIEDVNHAAFEDIPFVSPESGEKHMNIFAVCDGMGGAEHGEIASEMAVEALSRLHKKYAEQGNNSPAEFVREYIDTAQKSIAAERERRGAFSMGSTVVLACFKGESAFIANLGDSRAYHMRNSVLSRISKDQTELQYMIEKGEITEEIGQDSPMANTLVKFLGMKTSESRTASPYFGRKIDIAPRDVFLLCSDGLSGMLSEEEMGSIIKKGGTAKDMCESLVSQALARGGHDNITVIVIKVKEA